MRWESPTEMIWRTSESDDVCCLINDVDSNTKLKMQSAWMTLVKTNA